MVKKKTLKSGAIYTPSDLAGVMTGWALTHKNNKVLDLGVGEGVFTFAAVDTLRRLGATAAEASSQIYGSEIDTNAFDTFRTNASARNLVFPRIENTDFFSYNLSDTKEVDAVIGNPPYVRRYNIQSVEEIRQVVLNSTGLKTDDLKNLSDLYIYFILHAATMLRPGGRLCVVTADPWLNVGYGRTLKTYLYKNFSIDNLLTLDRRLFPNAYVRAVILHATKLGIGFSPKPMITFTRVHNGLSVERIPIYSPNPSASVQDVSEIQVRRDELSIKRQWGIYFKVGSLYKQLMDIPVISPVSQIADTQIGYQTLAKDFFIIPTQGSNQVESEFLRPIAQAPKYYFKRPIIYIDDEVECYVFYCNRPKEQLESTQALTYIELGEQKDVPVRGKGLSVKGYQSKDRIKRAKRPYWYDIQTYLDKRSACQILVPRFIYHEYLVVWNQAEYITGELFLEFRAKTNFSIKVYLAILNSSLAELMFRIHAQIYGGGTSNMSPGEFKNVPMLNPNFLSAEQRQLLIEAYDVFLKDDLQRYEIDNVVFRILKLDVETIEQIMNTLQDLQKLSKAVKKSNLDQSIQE